MEKVSFKERFVAFTWHILFSLVLAGLLSATVFILWFPGAYHTFGAAEGILIFIGIDLVLGPLLTFVVYKANKRELRRDIALIVFIQISAFLFGVWTISQQRPYIQVLDHRGVTIYTHDEAKAYGLSIPVDSNNGFIGPRKYFLYLPETLPEIKKIEFISEFIDKRSFSMRTDLYRSFSEGEQWGLNNLLSRFEHDAVKDCYWLNVYSIHFLGKSCMDRLGNILITK